MGLDAKFLVYKWIPPNTECPVLVDPRSYGSCHTCGQTFRRQPQHCHLCGELFDDACTARYHLPPPFANERSGPARICFACRNRCLAWHDQQLGINLSDLRRTLFKSDVVDGVLEIYPPAEWAQTDASVVCKTCDRKGLKRHHCRACGELYCSDCSSKMIVPDAFDKKHKNGPQRVCNECRFLIMTGAKWSEPNPINDVRKPFRNVITLHPSLSTMPLVDAGEPSCALRVIWRHDGEVLGEITAGLTWDLDIIDKVVRRLAPVLARHYVYTHRQRPVASEHWTAFTARVLMPDLVLCAPNSFQIIRRVNTMMAPPSR